MPIWLLGLSSVLGATRAGYDPLRDSLSELGAHGAVDPLLWQIGGFGILAVLELLYAFSLRAVFGGGWLFGLTVATAALLGVSAMAPCDPGCPAIPESTTMLVHTVAGLAIFVIFVLIPFAGWRIFRRRPQWQRWSRFSIAVGCVLAFWFVVGPTLGADRIGLWQRTFLAAYFAWQVAMAWRLAMYGRGAQRADATSS